MNARIVIILVAVLAVLALVITGVYFKVIAGKKQDTVAQAPPPDTDKDGVPDEIERSAGVDGNPNDSTVFPSFNARPASHSSVLLAAEGGIPSNAVIRVDDIIAKRFARGTFPGNAIPENRKNEVIGRITKVEIPGGAFVQQTMLFQGQQLSYVVPRFKRAVSIKYNKLMAVSDLIKPGDLVDVIGAFNVDRRPNERERGSPATFTKIVIQAARILAIEKDFGMPKPPPVADSAPASGAPRPPAPPPPAPDGITLAVTPREAEILVWAEDAGRLRLALRTSGSDAFSPTSGASRYDMYPSIVRNEARMVQVFHGALLSNEFQFEARRPIRNRLFGSSEEDKSSVGIVAKEDR